VRGTGVMFNSGWLQVPKKLSLGFEKLITPVVRGASICNQCRPATLVVTYCRVYCLKTGGETMAWVTVRQATELTGKARSSLYRDMAKGHVSYRSEVDGGRMLETSELIRAYGEIRQDETRARDRLRLSNETEKTATEALITEIKALREEVAWLRQEMESMRLLEHKTEIVEISKDTLRWWWPWGRR
jgi:hypothetical protein